MEKRQRGFWLVLILTCVVFWFSDVSAQPKLASPSTPAPKPQCVEKKWCAKNTLAAKNKIFNEPCVGSVITALLNAHEPEKAEALAKSTPSFIGLATLGSSESGVPKAQCFVWDIQKNDKVPDFITCRRFISNLEKQELSLSNHPGLYAADIDGSANGNLNKFIKFVDGDEDGDICDEEFVQLPESPKTHETPK